MALYTILGYDLLTMFNEKMPLQVTPKQKKEYWLGVTFLLIILACLIFISLRQLLNNDANNAVQNTAQEASTASNESTRDAPATDTEESSDSKVFTGSECESTLTMFCAPLLTRDWMAWCTSQVDAWRAVGLKTINPCANSKYARDSCTEASILGGKDVPDACVEYHAALNSSSANVQTMCLYTTRPGGVCEGVRPAPVPPGTAPENVVVPFDDCLRDHYAVLTSECQDAYDLHVAVSKSTRR